MSAVRGLVALAATLLAALALAPTAGAQGNEAGSITKTSSDGAVRATLSWDAAKGNEFGVRNPRLAIKRRGVLTSDLSVKDVCDGCILIADSPEVPDDSILHVVDLNGDGEPEVSFDTFSGGAHCCTTQRVYGFVPGRGLYRRFASIPWGNAGYRIKDLDGDGRSELVGEDDAFAYAFSSYASSWFPPKVLSYATSASLNGAVIENVTKRYPALVRENAAAALKIIRTAFKPGDTSHEIQGVLAGYVADQYLLGRASVGKAELARARKRKLTEVGFQTRLLRFLKQTGYR